MDGHDPSQQRQAQKRQAKLDAASSFEALARQWHQHNLEKWKANHAKNILARLQRNLFPVFGRVPAKELNRRLLLDTLQQVERRGAPSTARMLLNYATAILRYGVLHNVVPYNIALDLKGVLKPRRAGHFPSMEIEQLPLFLERFYGGKIKLGQDTRDAIALLMLTLMRRGELIGAEWVEIDFDKAIWTVPAVRMKMKRDHLVPLSKQAMAILQRRKKEQGPEFGVG